MSLDLREAVALKPCPFCGSDVLVNGMTDRRRFVMCVCDAGGPSGSDAALAANAWNRRAPDPQLSDLTVRCGELEGALTVIANASERSETMFGGKMSDVTRVFQNISRVARQALAAKAEDRGVSGAESARTGPLPVLTEAQHSDGGEEFLEFKEALSDVRTLRQEHRDLNGGGPGWSARWEAAWKAVDELFANEDEAAWVRQQEDAHG